MTDTLKSICEQCTHLHNPQLDFLPEEFQRPREIILRDLQELTSAASFEREKTVIMLAGGLFEAILYCFIQAQNNYIVARRGSFTFDPEHGLENYVSIFNKWFSDVLTIPDSIVGYRDMVHINRELQFPPDICPRAAREMLRLLDILVSKLSEAFGT
jgi:hypothetical protein